MFDYNKSLMYEPSGYKLSKKRANVPCVPAIVHAAVFFKVCTVRIKYLLYFLFVFMYYAFCMYVCTYILCILCEKYYITI